MNQNLSVYRYYSSRVFVCLPELLAGREPTGSLFCSGWGHNDKLKMTSYRRIQRCIERFGNIKTSVPYFLVSFLPIDNIESSQVYARDDSRKSSGMAPIDLGKCCKLLQTDPQTPANNFASARQFPVLYACKVLSLGGILNS